MKKCMIVLLCLVMSVLLCACGKFRCDMCGGEKGGQKHTSEAFGEEMVICDDCYEELKSLFE